MAAPTSGALTGAGYTLSNGVYSQTFGSLIVSFTLYENGSGGLVISPNGDFNPADVASVEASLAQLGIATINPNLVGAGLPPVQIIDVSAAGGTQSVGMSL